MEIDYDKLWKKPLLTKVEAIQLLDSFDHSILNKEGAEKICKPFNYKPQLYSIQDNRSEPKGAYFADLKEGDFAHDVIDSASLATDLADYLKIEYESYYGRGTQLHRTCEKILAELNK